MWGCGGRAAARMTPRLPVLSTSRRDIHEFPKDGTHTASATARLANSTPTRTRSSPHHDVGGAAHQEGPGHSSPRVRRSRSWLLSFINSSISRLHPVGDPLRLSSDLSRDGLPIPSYALDDRCSPRLMIDPSTLRGATRPTSRTRPSLISPSFISPSFISPGVSPDVSPDPSPAGRPASLLIYVFGLTHRPVAHLSPLARRPVVAHRSRRSRCST